MSRTIHVASRSELLTALAASTGGETILLAPGDYGKLFLGASSGFPVQFPSEVTITSADPENRAVFSEFDLRGASNLTFDGVVFDYTFSEGDPNWMRPFVMNGADNITIRNSVFDGDVTQGRNELIDGSGNAIGLGIRAGSSNIRIEDNEFHTFHRGISVSNSSDLAITGNELHSLRMDGMNFSQVQRVLIEDNHIHTFRRSNDPSDHADMIQFWTNGTTEPSEDVVIRGNRLDIAEGDRSQLIFMRNDLVDRGLAGEEMHYRNFLIEENVIYGSHSHGISIGATDGLTIRNNAVLYANPEVPLGTPVPLVQVPRINVNTNSTDVLIEHNATSAITGWNGQADWTVQMNAFVQAQDPLAPGYYGDVFVGSSLGLANGVHDYQALPGGMLDVLQAGASDILAPVGHGLAPAFHVIQDPENAALRSFDARFSAFDGKPVPPDAEFLWSFGDGLTATGPVVAHAFPDGGRYDVTLAVRLPDGTQAESAAQVSVAGSGVVALGEGGFRGMAFGVDTLIAPMDGDELALGERGVAASIGRNHISPIFSAESFEINFSLAAAHAEASGELFRLHGSFIASVTGAGELSVRLFTEGGERRLTTSGADLLDTEDGRSVQMLVENGRLSVMVDGTEVGATDVPDAISFGGRHALNFGNQWGRANFEGALTEFEINVDMADYEAARLLRDATVVAEPAPVEPAPVEPAPEAEPLKEFMDLKAPETPTSSDLAEPDTPAEDKMPAEDGAWRNIFHDDDWDGYALPLDTFTERHETMLRDDAALVETEHGLAIRLDGDQDHVRLGRMQEFEQSDRIGFSIDFTRGEVGGGEERLVWNHQKIGLTLREDAIIIHAGTAENGFRQFRIDDAGVGTTEMTRATVMLDAAEDRLQVLVNDQLVLDEQDTDFEIVGGREWGWSLGTAWNRFFDGEIHDFRLGDRFEFLDGTPQDNLFA